MANLRIAAPPARLPPLPLMSSQKLHYPNFVVPSAYYILEAQSYGVDFFADTGSYQALPPLPNGKSEAAAAALAFARAKATQAFAVLGALPNGRTHFDKHGLARVQFDP